MANFEVDPTVAVPTRKLVLLNEFRWDVGDLDADIFWVGHWRIEVEVLEVNGAEARSFAREYTIEQQLEEFKGRSVGANIPRVADAIASDGDASTIRIVFIRPHLTHYHGVADFPLFVGRDVMVINDKESVSACNPFESGWHQSQFLDTNVQAHWCMPYPLAEKVADMSATCRPDSQMSSLLAKMPLSRRHNLILTHFCLSGFADIHQNFLFSITRGTYGEFLCKF